MNVLKNDIRIRNKKSVKTVFRQFWTKACIIQKSNYVLNMVAVFGFSDDQFLQKVFDPSRRTLRILDNSFLFELWEVNYFTKKYLVVDQTQTPDITREGWIFLFVQLRSHVRICFLINL